MGVLMGLRGPPVVISTEDPRHQDPEAVAIIDAKSVYVSTASSNDCSKEMMIGQRRRLQ